MEKIRDALDQYKKTGGTTLLDDAAVNWSGWLVRNTHGKRLRLGLEISIAIANYVAFETERHGKPEGDDGIATRD